MGFSHTTNGITEKETAHSQSTFIDPQFHYHKWTRGLIDKMTSWRFLVEGPSPWCVITSGSPFPQRIIEQHFNRHMRPTLEVFDMMCIAIDKVGGILDLKVSFRLLEGAASDAALPVRTERRLHLVGLGGFFKRSQNKRIASKLKAALVAAQAVLADTSTAQPQPQQQPPQPPPSTPRRLKARNL